MRVKAIKQQNLLFSEISSSVCGNFHLVSKAKLYCKSWQHKLINAAVFCTNN